MATVLLIGSDGAVLEGVAQSLAGLGHRTRFAHSMSEAIELASADPPLVAVVQRDMVSSVGGIRRLPLAAGGTLVLYRSQGAACPSLPASVLRATIADLTLPLERHRLVTLIQQVDERARRAGRDGEHRTPPDAHRAL